MSRDERPRFYPYLCRQPPVCFSRSKRGHFGRSCNPQSRGSSSHHKQIYKNVLHATRFCPVDLFVSFYLFVAGFTTFPLPLLAVTRRVFLTTPYNLSQDGFLVRPGWRVLPSLFFFLCSFCLGAFHS